MWKTNVEKVYKLQKIKVYTGLSTVVDKKTKNIINAVLAKK